MKIIKIIAFLIAACMSLSLLSCAGTKNPVNGDDNTAETNEKYGISTAVPNKDGEIGGSEDKGSAYYSTKDYYTKEAAAEARSGDYLSGVATASEWTYAYPSATYTSDGTVYPIDGGVLFPDGTSQETYTAGTLTAGEWRDNKNWSDWLTKIAVPEWTQIAESWGVSVKNRVCVEVTNGTAPVKNAKVILYDGSGNELYRAVTDYEGNAYLFWSSKDTAASANYPEANQPKSVKITAAGAESISVAFNGEEKLNVTLNNAASAPAAKKLDLMFVVDTTGSMGDELEYLKAELKDVVARASAASGTAVRTSVNFYRDDGDEYVVRYFGFKDDINDAVNNISAQSAYGGGDYAEAVHTALYNAVYDHAWDDGDSVKLLFLILDAPPHDDAQVKESLLSTVREAAARGIRIIPVLSSGTDTTCEVLYRSIAVMTGGTYAFLTDDSGVGYGHAAQNVGQYTVEKLNDLMVRIITEFCS